MDNNIYHESNMNDQIKISSPSHYDNYNDDNYSNLSQSSILNRPPINYKK